MEKKILESIYRESPIGKPSFALEVLAPALLLTAAIYVSVEVVYGGQAARIAAAAVCAIVLLWRLWVWDENGRPVSITEHNWYKETPEATPQIRPATVDAHVNVQRWRIGKWNFTEAEWQRLGQALAAGRITRDLLGSIERDNGEKMFTNITANYSDYVRELQRIGWIDDSNAVTDVCWQWLRERSLAPPPESE